MDRAAGDIHKLPKTVTAGRPICSSVHKLAKQEPETKISPIRTEQANSIKFFLLLSLFYEFAHSLAKPGLPVIIAAGVRTTETAGPEDSYCI